MSNRKQRIKYELDSGAIRYLADEEIIAILRAADDIIGTGGRSMLAKILKGSADKRLLQHGLDQCPVYGYYWDFTLQEITNRIDWMLMNDFLKIEYSNEYPLLIFSEKGWDIERETIAEELYQKLKNTLKTKDYSFVGELKDRNRQMILLLIYKIRTKGSTRFIPLLNAWKEIEYKKVQTEIQKVIDHFMDIAAKKSK
jgi:superfamily II DNA helicase RecQ